MIKNLLLKYRVWEYAESQHNKVLNARTLLNACYKSKTIFRYIPKNTGVSLTDAIYGDVTSEGHRSFYFYSIAFNIKNEKLFHFTFVRNPFDLLYSVYKFLIKGGMNHLDSLAFKTHLPVFKDFILNSLNKKLIYQITHLIPQYQFLCDMNGGILVDFICRFKKFENHILLLSKKLKKDIKLSHHNYIMKLDYKEVYIDEVIDNVYQIYQSDIEILKYTFKEEC